MQVNCFFRPLLCADPWCSCFQRIGFAYCPIWIMQGACKCARQHAQIYYCLLCMLLARNTIQTKGSVHVYSCKGSVNLSNVLCIEHRPIPIAVSDIHSCGNKTVLSVQKEATALLPTTILKCCRPEGAAHSQPSLELVQPGCWLLRVHYYLTNL